MRQFVLEHTPLSVYQRLVPRDVLALCYHIVADDPPAHVRHLYDFKTRAAFEADLDYLERRYQPLSYEQVEHLRSGRGSAPADALLVTFDDGYRECFTIARSALLERRIPCVFFVSTDFLDNRAMLPRNQVSLCIDRILQLDDVELGVLEQEIRDRFEFPVGTRVEIVAWASGLNDTELTTIATLCNLLKVDVATYLAERQPYLTIDQVRQLAADGFTIGAHGSRHARLDELSDSAAIEREIVASCQFVSDLVGGGRIPFAFPYHGDGIDRILLAEIRRKHPVVGLFFDSRKLRRDDPFVVQRAMADSPHGARSGGTNLPGKLRELYRAKLRGELR